MVFVVRATTAVRNQKDDSTTVLLDEIGTTIHYTRWTPSTTLQSTVTHGAHALMRRYQCLESEAASPKAAVLYGPPIIHTNHRGPILEDRKSSGWRLLRPDNFLTV